jgi:hypothetical protein
MAGKTVDVPEDLSAILDYVSRKQVDRTHGEVGYFDRLAPVVQFQIKEMLLPTVLDVVVALEHPELLTAEAST